MGDTESKEVNKKYAHDRGACIDRVNVRFMVCYVGLV